MEYFLVWDSGGTGSKPIKSLHYIIKEFIKQEYFESKRKSVRDYKFFNIQGELLVNDFKKKYSVVISSSEFLWMFSSQ